MKLALLILLSLFGRVSFAQNATCPASPVSAASLLEDYRSHIFNHLSAIQPVINCPNMPKGVDEIAYICGANTNCIVDGLRFLSSFPIASSISIEYRAGLTESICSQHPELEGNSEGACHKGFLNLYARNPQEVEKILECASLKVDGLGVTHWNDHYVKTEKLIGHHHKKIGTNDLQIYIKIAACEEAAYEDFNVEEFYVHDLACDQNCNPADPWARYQDFQRAIIKTLALKNQRAALRSSSKS